MSAGWTAYCNQLATPATCAPCEDGGTVRKDGVAVSKMGGAPFAMTGGKVSKRTSCHFDVTEGHRPWRVFVAARGAAFALIEQDNLVQFAGLNR
jgi:hypothetical protein